MESLHILDCYRICILQRPPSLLWQHLEIQSAKASDNGTPDSIRHLLTTISNPGFHVDSENLKDFSLAALSALSAFLWPTMPLAPAGIESAKTLSRPEFVELAADKWLRSHEGPADPAALILYHLLNIAMHTNLLVVQNYAHLQLRGENFDKDKDPYHPSILRWVNGRYYQIAKWHAERTLECVETEITLGSREDSNCIRHKGFERAPMTGAIDVAHVPYAIYYATLVLWCGTAVHETRNDLSQLSYLTRGRNILGRQKLRIATLLDRVLSQVGN